MSNKAFSNTITKKMADLSKLHLDLKEQAYFTRQFNETLNIVDQLNQLKTDKFKPTYNVTGLVNVFREDVIDKNKMLSQAEALSNTKQHYRGYFIIKAIFK